ncbi:uncharacterized protein TRAVEDRAFT_29707 [Trametes versicolor FP-101664 SS1]|uniref:uncharacterized protein n=1 Tax=Trametes versicolor (strain FP-101664) TaxID=717944 RepID=UPI0004621FDF|nr:uncharacterized protein TRAVEDRAFT_29707 [Trametes versicolor FP-101664 SS1]EIW57705.1 hypothetical protein TRAVEDRAFT_29707 [Trametes versicolor FP-101664 SS1]
MQAILQSFSGLSVKDLAGLLTTRTIQIVPSVAKYLVILLFLVQIRSWPFTWHWRVWSPVFALRGRFLLHKCSNLLRSPATRKVKNLEWLEEFSPIGANPFEKQFTYKMWAGPDDCDFNLHLSNSSYPKHLDGARFRYALKCGPTFFRAGGWMGLGATHFTFLREIPMFAHYEMRVGLLSFDSKWLFIVTRFVTKAKPKGKKAAIKSASPPPAPASNPTLHTANGLNTGTSTPLPSDASAPNAKTLAAQLIERPEPDGAVLNCLAISEVVCKIGRITVPPALVYAMDGFCALSPEGKPYSRTNLPPHWDRVRALRGDAHPGLVMPGKAALKTLRNYYTHGWREEPEDARWWEQALGGEIEERRLKALAAMQGLRRGMEEARAY